MGHKKSVFPILLDEKSLLFRQFKATRIHLHLTCLPEEEVQVFWEADFGVDPKAEKAKTINLSNLPT